MTDRRKAVADIVRKSSPTGSAVHVPGIMGEADADKKRKRKKALAKLIAQRGQGDAYTLTKEKRIEKADSAQYIGRLLLNADAFAAWWASVRHDSEPVAIDPNPHLTVAYSSVTFPWTIDRSYVVILPEQIKGVGLLGPKNALVIFLDSPLLESRWDATIEAGADWSYDGYQPHMTVCYLGAGYDSTTWRDTNGGTVPLPDFPLVFGPELMATKGVDVFEAVKAPEWYQNAKGVQKQDQQPVHVTVNMPPMPAPQVNVTVEAAKPTNKVGTVIRDPNGGPPTIKITEVEAPTLTAE